MVVGARVRQQDLARDVKTSRAFRAYINLMDAADWLRGGDERAAGDV